MDIRLLAVAELIRAPVHVDIGSDHGELLVSLLKSGRVESGIAIENKQRPFQNSIRALTNLTAEVRFGDGLEPLIVNEADSLSICGMGAERMIGILDSFPERVPDRVVLQPNHKPEIVRAWALRSSFHLLNDKVTYGRRRNSILSFKRVSKTTGLSDPAYAGVDLDSALLFGPMMIKRKDDEFEARLREEEAYWSRFDRLVPKRVQRLALIRKLINDQQQDGGVSGTSSCEIQVGPERSV